MVNVVLLCLGSVEIYSAVYSPLVMRDVVSVAKIVLSEMNTLQHTWFCLGYFANLHKIYWYISNSFKDYIFVFIEREC